MEFAEDQCIGDRDALEFEAFSDASRNASEDYGYLKKLAIAFGQVHSEDAPPPNPDTRGDDDGENVEFRLFTGSQAQKISLERTVPGSDESGFVRPRRLQDFYFSPAASGDKLENYRFAAITGDDVRQELGRRWKGCELLWRVAVIKAPTLARKALGLDNPAISGEGRRCRKGKKTRIAIRKRIAAKKTEKDEREKMRAEKEMQEKEKRIARNREKKAKRRQKQRDAKAAAKVVG